MDNNPRVFAETVSVDAWRTEFVGDKAEADLHIDVVFSKGRIGGDDIGTKSPVRFRMSLKRAEVHIVRDTLRTIRIPPSSVFRTAPSSGTSEYREEKAAAAGVDVGFSVGVPSLQSASGRVVGDAKASKQITETYQEIAEVPHMKVVHGRTGDGYVFRIEPSRGDRLDGQPWSSEIPRAKLVDTRAGRKYGEPPEVTIEVRCRREDLIIEDVQFKDASLMDFIRLPQAKRVAVEQYIKSEIEKMGLYCGNISDPFSTIVLGDVSPYVE